MKLIVAIIKPFRLDEVKEALTGLGVQGLTVSEEAARQRREGETATTVGFSRFYYWLMRNVVGMREMPPTGADMFLADRADNLLPDWAFFIQAVVNANDLRPTAGRDSFYEDANLLCWRPIEGHKAE